MDLKDIIRSLLASVREVEKWREEYDLGTAEWFTLLNLSDEVSSLIDRLSPELLPEEELQHAESAEAALAKPPTAEELIKLMGL
ncbi:hypothetical protein [Streptomyces sp. NPDC092295]|uniref:hypothetical protein n=1 Tax=Streptomyces sp. NPDC092295 TaxID=3366011 RepID=UPI003824B9F7